MEPTIEMKREILTAKRDQLRAQGYEHSLNAVCNEMQLRTADSEQEKAELRRAIQLGKKFSRQKYDAAAELDRMLKELPEPVAEPEAD